MHYLLAALPFVALVAALPTEVVEKRTPTSVAPRCGTTIYPSYISWLDSATPDVPAGAKTQISTFATTQTGPWRLAQVQFQVPAGARGACSLEFSFPGDANIAVDGQTQLQVYKTSAAIGPSDTWSHAPTPTFLFGIVNPVRGTSGTVNSEGCAPVLNYYVQVWEQWEYNSRSTTPGSVQFTNNQQQGLRLTYGC
ncbi:MAG: hypothetical protein M1832_000940 [Thelocarpon impressellum]|nr:MAG: hypothetical protein M1832_000940 [Thelocarpon impressellum]